MPGDNSQIVTRLHKDVFDQLIKQVQPLHVQATTSELQAGFMLGQQHILQLLRDGIVVGGA